MDGDIRVQNDSTSGIVEYETSTNKGVIGFVGINKSGKTTLRALMRVMSGDDKIEYNKE